jgi:2-dehydro-3-deoxygluconokinase
VPVYDLEVMDRIGGGDGFGAGLFYGILENMDPETALRYGWAHGALVATTPGDTTMATLRQVQAFVEGQSQRVTR